MADTHEHTDNELSEIKKRLKSGKVERKDLEVLESLVERAERAAKQLRAAVVE